MLANGYSVGCLSTCLSITTGLHLTTKPIETEIKCTEVYMKKIETRLNENVFLQML